MTIYVEWIHPSVRDLVIDYLAGNDAERVAFLQKATTNGLGLAISTAGGTRGDRVLPLLRKRHDWDALTERAVEVATSGGPAEHYRLLEILQAAVRHGRGEPHEKALAAVVGRVLTTMGSLWNARGEAIPLLFLRPFLAASEATHPLVPIPNLAPTWAKVSVRPVEGDVPDGLGPEDLLSIHEWLILARLISRYEPRFLRQVRLDRYLGYLTACVRGVEAWLGDLSAPEQEYDDESGEPVGMSGEDEETEATLVGLSAPLDAIGFLFPALATEARAVAASCSDLADELRGLEHEREQWREERAAEALEDWEPEPDDAGDDLVS